MAISMYKDLPANGIQKSFYDKAKVGVCKDGSVVLFSYGTPVMVKKSDGRYARLWDGWSMTTGKHIKAFSGMNKKQFEGLPFDKLL